MAGPKPVLNSFIDFVSLARTAVGGFVPIPVVMVVVEAPPPAETRFLLYSDRAEGVESIAGRPEGSVAETVALILGDCLISDVDRGVWWRDLRSFCAWASFVFRESTSVSRMSAALLLALLLLLLLLLLLETRQPLVENL